MKYLSTYPTFVHFGAGLLMGLLAGLLAFYALPYGYEKWTAMEDARRGQ